MEFQLKHSGDVNISIEKISQEDGIALYEVKAKYLKEQIPESFAVMFSVPHVELCAVRAIPIRQMVAMTISVRWPMS